MADIDLPVLPFRINWAEGITERLTFLTSLLKGEEGAEQRFSRRITPRRVIEADFLLSGPERTFYDLFVHKHGGGEFTVPLYWDVGITTAVLTATASDRIDFDTRWTEFVPGLAILQGKTAMSFEVVEIVAVDDNGLDLADPVLSTWPRGTRVMPLRRAVLDDMGSMTHHSAEVASISAQIGLTVANPRTLSVDDSTIYDGLPVFLQESNWVESLDVGMARDLVKLDNDTGLPYQVDPTGRANLGQAHRWLLRNREDTAALRDFLYRQQGRRGQFWLPTFKGDLKLSSAALSAATQLLVKNAGLVYTDVPTSGRDHLAIFPRGSAPVFREITSTANGPTAATERVNLDLALGLDLSPGLARKISFLDTAHFDQDDFEINHLSSTVAEMTAAFRTFKNTRDPSGVIHYPIPAAEMSTLPCTDPGPCYVGDLYIRFRFEFLGPWDGNGRIGEPGLGFWCKPQFSCHGLHGPNDGFVCKDYAQWAELDHGVTGTGEGDGPCTDDFYTPQWIEVRIQGGTGTAGCPSEGDRRERIRLLVHKPGWPKWRAALADIAGHGSSNFIDGMSGVPNAVTGIGGFQSSGFPGTMYFWMPSNYDDDGWAEYTLDYEGT